MANRAYNFSAGPAMMPEEVVEQAQEGLYSWNGTGVGVAEMSHRSTQFISIAEYTENALRQLLGIGHDYAVLFLNDGATRQFAMVPRNLARGRASADYIQTGYWSQKAIDEAEKTKFVTPRIAGSTKGVKYRRVPLQNELDLDTNAAYVHYTDNETIGGLKFPYVPDTGSMPLVSDVSSSFLSEPFDIKRFGLVYASAQKNVGVSGLHIVVARKDLIGHAPSGTPSLEDYAVHAKAKSMENTPSTFGIYMTGLMLDWIRQQGGLDAMAERNRAKAAALYGFIDGSGFYGNPIEPSSRSRMNVPFTLAVADEARRLELEKIFVSEAEEESLVGLVGHRSVGGMRASIYNAMPMEGVDALISFMKNFEKRNNL